MVGVASRKGCGGLCLGVAVLFRAIRERGALDAALTLLGSASGDGALGGEGRLLPLGSSSAATAAIREQRTLVEVESCPRAGDKSSAKSSGPTPMSAAGYVGEPRMWERSTASS